MKLKLDQKSIPNCERITKILEPLCCKASDIRSSCRIYNIKKCASQKIINACLIFLLGECLNKNTKKKHTVGQGKHGKSSEDNKGCENND